MKIDYQTWQSQIIRDVKNLVTPENGLNFEVQDNPRFDPYGLCAVATGDKPIHPWLDALDRGSYMKFYLLEVVIAYRAPFQRECAVYDPFGVWMKTAAEKLYAHESWVKFFHYLAHPMATEHSSVMSELPDYGARLWQELHRGSFPQLRRKWEDVSYTVNSFCGSAPRMKFWSKDVRWPEIVGKPRQ